MIQKYIITRLYFRILYYTCRTINLYVSSVAHTREHKKLNTRRSYTKRDWIVSKMTLKFSEDVAAPCSQDTVRLVLVLDLI